MGLDGWASNGWIGRQGREGCIGEGWWGLVLKQGSCISCCFISLHHLPLFLCCCPFGSSLARPVRSTSVWGEASGFQGQCHRHGMSLSQCRVALCLQLHEQGAQVWGTAGNCVPPEAVVLHTLRTEHPLPRGSRSHSAALLSTVAKKEKHSTFSSFHFHHCSSLIHCEPHCSCTASFQLPAPLATPSVHGWAVAAHMGSSVWGSGVSWCLARAHLYVFAMATHHLPKWWALGAW